MGIQSRAGVAGRSRSSSGLASGGDDRLRRQRRRLVARERLEPQPEDIGDRARGGGAHVVDMSGRSSSRAIVVNWAPSRPHAVIQSVNGAGSRSTFRA